MQLAVNAADIYLRKNDPSQAKEYIDTAMDYHARTRVPEKNSGLYEVLARYYAYIGDGRVAAVYMDSTLVAAGRENDAFNGLVLRRIEQRLRAADRRLHEQEIEAEQARSRNYLHTVILVSVALASIILLLVWVLIFYRRLRNAYRELVKRSRSWAGVEAPKGGELPGEGELADFGHSTTDSVNISAETTVEEGSDRILMECINRAMSEKKLYKRADLTLDILAEETGFNRYYVSGALNRCTGGNFSSYVNEYRVKEAIRIMSAPGSGSLTIDGIAFESGFDNRVSFYRAFKKITGLSPTDFRKNAK